MYFFLIKNLRKKKQKIAGGGENISRQHSNRKQIKLLTETLGTMS